MRQDVPNTPAEHYVNELVEQGRRAREEQSLLLARSGMRGSRGGRQGTPPEV